ncbi:MAG: PKD domain-containing protein, partial [Saprospiraceae bacterium]|nr:PKD domain-containing protein [Saprospiraceae bacterium]
GIHTYTVTVTDANGCTNTANVQIEVWDNPQVNASVTGAFCNDGPIILEASGTAGSGLITGYAWSGPFGFSSTLEDPVINPGDAAYPTQGTHTYTVTVTDDNGCTSIDQVIVTVNAVPTVTASGPAQVCDNLVIALQATGVAGGSPIAGYAWSGPFGYTSTLEDPVINPGDVAYPAAGNHTYTVTITDSNGCTNTSSVNIEVWDAPTVTASAAADLCGNEPILLGSTATAGSAPVVSYAWSGPLSYTSNNEDPVINPTNEFYPGPGTHTYTVTVTDANGCTGTDDVVITINDEPTVTASAVGASCNDADIFLSSTGTAGGAPITTFAWSGPNGFTSSAEDPVIPAGDAAYPPVGPAVYTVTVTDDNGCTGTASVTITINAVPTVSATTTPTVCEDFAITLDATGVVGSAAITGYAWSGPFGFTSNIEDPTINPGSGAYPTPGNHTYTVTVTDANGCTNTATIGVEVWDNPEVSISSATVVCGNGAISLDATGTVGSAAITGYAWSGPAGFSSSLEDPTINPGDAAYPGPGTFTYTVTVTDANGCTGTDDIIITVNAVPTVTATAASAVCGNLPIALQATGVAGGAPIAGYAWSGPFGYSSSLEDPVINPG